MEKVMNNEHAKVLRDFRLQTDRMLEHNTPDLTFVERNKILIMGVAIPGDGRIDDKDLEKSNTIPGRKNRTIAATAQASSSGRYIEYRA